MLFTTTHLRLQNSQIDIFPYLIYDALANCKSDPAMSGHLLNTTAVVTRLRG